MNRNDDRTWSIYLGNTQHSNWLLPPASNRFQTSPICRLTIRPIAYLVNILERYDFIHDRIHRISANCKSFIEEVLKNNLDLFIAIHCRPSESKRNCDKAQCISKWLRIAARLLSPKTTGLSSVQPPNYFDIRLKRRTCSTNVWRMTRPFGRHEIRGSMKMRECRLPERERKRDKK